MQPFANALRIEIVSEKLKERLLALGVQQRIRRAEIKPHKTRQDKYDSFRMCSSFMGMSVAQ